VFFNKYLSSGCAVGKKWLRFGFGFTKLTAVSVFSLRFLHCVLFNVYDARNVLMTVDAIMLQDEL